jgi:hypothetical protein
MIPNNGPHVARYVHLVHPRDRFYARITAWREDGAPLVVDENGLVPAGDLEMTGYRFDGVVDAYEVGAEDKLPILQIIPAHGVRLKNAGPVVAWALKAGGEVVPISNGGEGEGMQEWPGDYVDPA